MSSGGIHMPTKLHDVYGEIDIGLLLENAWRAQDESRVFVRAWSRKSTSLHDLDMYKAAAGGRVQVSLARSDHGVPVSPRIVSPLSTRAWPT